MTILAFLVNILTLPSKIIYINFVFESIEIKSYGNEFIW
jgi:hypothetical protein